MLGFQRLKIYIVLIDTGSQINSLDLSYLLDLYYLLLIGGMEHVDIGHGKIHKRNTIPPCPTCCVS